MTTTLKLLDRDTFRESVFARDRKLCVICKNTAADAHHIMERRLFTDKSEFGGYFLDNGASVCPSCHILSEKTLISTDQIREAAGIKNVVLPSHLYDDEKWDKWGNLILQNGQRLKGELFHDENVQKILKEAGILNIFTKYIKYPRTYHVPWSLGLNDDDRVHTTTNQWNDKRVIVSIKMDGENTTMYNDHVHARSIDSGGHPSRTWVKNYWSTIAHEIADNWRICGENMYSTHSIHYTGLESYFMGFSIWNDLNRCLSWDATLEIFSLLGITPVKVVYDGIYDEKAIIKIQESLDFDTDEGYVIRLADEFSYGEFKKYVGKFVRKDHIKTTKHWMRGQQIIPNKLA